MDFELTGLQESWRDRGRVLGRDLAASFTAEVMIAASARAGLLDRSADLVAKALAIEALACESASAGMTLALHTAALLSVPDDQAAALAAGDIVGALSLSTEQIPSIEGGALSGRASWVGPVTPRGITIIGARLGTEITTRVVELDAVGVRIEPDETSGLDGVLWAHVRFANAACRMASAPAGIVALARTLISAVALGIGSRALRESLVVAERYRGAGGEQTVQGLLADSATELDAARLLTWKAAETLSVANASMAKLAATIAAQAAVIRATQVVGVDSFRRGHPIERLTQDVRAIELFAGRTEALREAVGDATLPHT